MNKVWVVAADSTRARFFREQEQSLFEVEDLVNPLARAADRDLVTDNRGRTAVGGDSVRRHAFGDDYSEREHNRVTFAREVANRLEHLRASGELERFYLIAERRFLGLLRKEMPRELSRLLAEDQAKGMAGVDAGALRAMLPRRL